mmetsp:Transcript_69631/g.181110  ORF Transcript_69631/g.181110 Transcript_69631/m.181110 type:complete len:300 (+) Transcript_69631:303-1202(+)
MQRYKDVAQSWADLKHLQSTLLLQGSSQRGVLALLGLAQGLCQLRVLHALCRHSRLELLKCTHIQFPDELIGSLVCLQRLQDSHVEIPAVPCQKLSHQGVEESVAVRHILSHFLKAFQGRRQGFGQVLPRDGSRAQQTHNHISQGVFLRLVVETGVEQPLDALLGLFAARLPLLPILRQLLQVPVLIEVLSDPLDIGDVPHNPFFPAPGRRRPTGGNDIVDVRWPHADDRCGEHGIGACSLGHFPALGHRLFPDLVLRRGLVFEELLLPSLISQLEEVLDQELHALRVGGVPIWPRLPL